MSRYLTEYPFPEDLMCIPDFHCSERRVPEVFLVVSTGDFHAAEPFVFFGKEEGGELHVFDLEAGLEII